MTTVAVPADDDRHRLGRLLRRAQFKAVAGHGRKWAAPGLVLQSCRQPAAARADHSVPPVRYGLTASRKVGGAVVRNRARRRLRAAAERVLAEHAAPGFDFVLIARDATVRRPFDALIGDLCAGLRRVGAWREAGVPDGASRPGQPR